MQMETLKILFFTTNILLLSPALFAQEKTLLKSETRDPHGDLHTFKKVTDTSIPKVIRDAHRSMLQIDVFNGLAPNGDRYGLRASSFITKIKDDKLHIVTAAHTLRPFYIDREDKFNIDLESPEFMQAIKTNEKFLPVIDLYWVDQNGVKQTFYCSVKVKEGKFKRATEVNIHPQYFQKAEISVTAASGKFELAEVVFDLTQSLCPDKTSKYLEDLRAVKFAKEAPKEKETVYSLSFPSDTERSLDNEDLYIYKQIVQESGYEDGITLLNGALEDGSSGGLVINKKGEASFLVTGADKNKINTGITYDFNFKDPESAKRLAQIKGH